MTAPPRQRCVPGELGKVVARATITCYRRFVAQKRPAGPRLFGASLIATLRKAWDLGDALDQRDASARTFEHVFTRAAPRDPQAWTTFDAQPVPESTMDDEVVGQASSTLGKAAAPALIERARELGVALPPQLDDPSVELTGALIIKVLRDVS
jgi:hypothetical protein